ncbi:predicted protein [Chaetomium globosum CBS 148.51]|uniref:Uncharacterized protein n=1 Tax=Chaetomium globosum (strain ATCC 6205 / CBS 148.51 / DSM 1962 / NBRC 6347 / NRRL 1970) TaxID=306901 RepID=Q2H1E3_CHAGB|nr:uncharacterized protein CHGG_04403 [Chaetomium globosum CBS 148.51]EAQ87784.1 predicted protein [Chaetomium globosum CBS 148.51]
MAVDATVTTPNVFPIDHAPKPPGGFSTLALPAHHQGQAKRAGVMLCEATGHHQRKHPQPHVVSHSMQWQRLRKQETKMSV